MDGRARRIGLVLAFGGLLALMDAVMTAVALPAIVTGLDTSLPKAAWTTSGYVLAMIAVIPLSGWLAARYGDSRVYVVGLTVFIVASVAAGCAPTVELLVLGRVVQGLGGGLLTPLGTAIGMRSVPQGVRGRMMSIVGLPVLVGPVVAPLLTGVLVDAASWRWLFWINLPLGVLALGLCARYLPDSRRGEDAGVAGEGTVQVDGGGLVLSVAGCTGLVLALTRIGESGRITVVSGVLFAFGAGAMVWFVRHCLRRRHPIVQVQLLARRDVAAGAGTLLFFAAGYFGAATITPAFVQGVRGDSVSVAGYLVIPTGIAVGLTLQVATRLVDRVDPRRVIIVGTSTALVGAVASGVALSVDAPYIVLGATGVLVGVGSGATLMPSQVAATRALDSTDLPQATGLLVLCSQMGNALGTALVAMTMTLLISRVDGVDGGLGGMVALDAGTRADLSDRLATAVGASYATPAVLLLLAVVSQILIAGSLSLRRRAP